MANHHESCECPRCHGATDGVAYHDQGMRVHLCTCPAPVSPAVLRLVEALKADLKYAPVAADFESGGRYNYDMDCGNTDDAAKLYEARNEFARAEILRPLLAAVEREIGGGK